MRCFILSLYSPRTALRSKFHCHSCTKQSITRCLNKKGKIFNTSLFTVVKHLRNRSHQVTFSQLKPNWYDLKDN